METGSVVVLEGHKTHEKSTHIGGIDWGKVKGVITPNPSESTMNIVFIGGGLQDQIKGLIAHAFVECRDVLGLEKVPNIHLQAVREESLQGTPARVERRVINDNVDYHMLISNTVIPDQIFFLEKIGEILSGRQLSNLDEKEIAQSIVRVLNIIAHETYHIRQLELNNAYYKAIQQGENPDTSDPDEYKRLTKERGARAVALRYLIEKERAMRKKAQSDGLNQLETVVHKYMWDEIRHHLNDELRIYGKTEKLDHILDKMTDSQQRSTDHSTIVKLLDSLLGDSYNSKNQF